jgi:hypothetical protein
VSALNGNLRDFGIAEVFQLIGQQAKTGMLEIQDGARCFHLFFDSGAVVWASPAGVSDHSELGDRLVRCGLLTRERLADLTSECESSARSLPTLAVSVGAVSKTDIEQIRDLLTRETIFEVLRWTQGSFRFVAQPISHDRPPEALLGAEQILMEGLRMVDEWQTFAAQVPTPDMVFQRVGRFEVYRQKTQGDARRRLSEAEAVFELVDGRLSCQRVIDLSRLGTFDATRVLSELRTGGCIEPVHPSLTRRVPSPAASSLPASRKIRSVLAAALPLAMLALAVSLVFQAPPEPEAELAIERSPIEAARLEFEKRRLRHAVEAERFLHGEWPSDLRGAAMTGLVAEDSLARPPHDAYYYARRADELLLLAPEH